MKFNDLAQFVQKRRAEHIQEEAAERANNEIGTAYRKYRTQVAKIG